MNSTKPRGRLPERQHVAELYKLGASTHEIARIYGVTPPAVNKALRRAGAQLRPQPSASTRIVSESQVRELWERGLSPAEMATKLGVSLNTAYRSHRRCGLTPHRKHVNQYK